MNIFYRVIRIMTGAFTVFNLLGLFFSLVYVIRLFLTNLKELKFYRNNGGINSFMRFNLLFNNETQLYKTLLLIVMLLIELFAYLSIALMIIIETHLFDFYVNSSIHCTRKFHVKYLVNLLFHNQLIILIPFFIAVLSVTGVLVSSFLTTYLCRRYHGYSLDNRIKGKYVVWWCYQVVLLLLCCLPYLQVLFVIVFYILFTIDLIILVRESRRLVRVLKSVVDEILRFEYDEVRYKQSYSSYLVYKIFIRCQLACLFTLDLFIFILQIIYTFQYAILLNCEENFLSYFEVEIPTKDINSFLSMIVYFLSIAALLFSFLSSLPWILFGCLSLTRYCTKQMNILRYEKHLSHQFIHNS